MSRYGMRAGRQTGEQRMHAGIDIGAPRGAGIFAPRPGWVVLVGRETDGRGTGLRGYGNAVVLHHPDENLYSFYAHMARVDVRVGQEVRAGERLGTIGNTTNGKFRGMGRHLHMEVRTPKADGSSPFPGRYGTYNRDPAEWLAGHGIGFARSGLTADAGRQACASPVRLSRELEFLSRGEPSYPSPRSGGSLFLRGGLGDVNDPNDRYEPPIPDPDFFKPLKPLIKAIVPASLIGIGLVGVALTLGEQ